MSCRLISRKTWPLQFVIAVWAVVSIVPVSGAATAASGEAPPRAIADPYYGDSLFQFYQRHYFLSVTGLMASQHFGRVSQHADEAEVLRGGLLLSYGMHLEAGHIFEQLIERQAAPSVRDRAWFYLAKIRYQRAFFTEAENAIQRIEKSLPPDLEEERGLLHTNLLMARADYAGAAKLLDSMTHLAGAGLYARYNLGVALIKSGDTPRGMVMLDELGRASSPGAIVPKGGAATEEFLGLRDKANVALGFAELQGKRPASARSYLERVRLSGMQSNKALLGFGWAADALGQRQQALVPWTELSQRDPGDAAVLEAMIAVPYALAELGASAQSLQGYQAAIATFEQESASLDESIQSIRDGNLIEGLIALNPGEEMGWFWSIDQLPKMPHANHLTAVLAQHEFQEAFKNYRDLQFLARSVEKWQDSLGVFVHMLENRREAVAQRLPQIRQKALASKGGLESLQQQLDGLAKEQATAEAQADGEAFADARQRELADRLKGVRAALARAGGDESLSQAQERVRLTAGALKWELAQAYSDRLWKAQKGVAVGSAGLSEARRRGAALAAAEQNEPARLDALDARIHALDQRLGELFPRVNALAQEQQRQAQELVVAELMNQKGRLIEYVAQARFAIAQLYDRANKIKDSDHAVKP